MPQILISGKDIRGSSIVIDDARYRHIRSLRVKIGQGLVFRDEWGKGYIGILRHLSRHRAVFEISDRLSDTRPGSGIILAQSIIKKDRMLLALEKATELGVDAIVPFVSHYTIVRPHGTGFQSKYQAAIREAVGQCMRPDVPMLHEPATFKGLFDTAGNACILLFHVGSETSPVSGFLQEIQQAESVLLVVGPEGGFSEGEIALATAHGAHSVSLGRSILRSETAAAVSVGVVTFIREQLRS